jgi:coniferyl-aldehyde dehydrogenase
MAGSEAMRLLELQRGAFLRDGSPSLKRRLFLLKRLEAMLRSRSDAFATAIAADFGHRSPYETLLLETGVVLSGIRHARRHLGRWMAEGVREVEPTFWPGRARVRREPLGVVGIIAPWNYPLQLCLSPLTDILAAGNRAILKPSELTPTFTGALAAAIAETFAPEEVAVVTGGPDVAAAFARLPFDHLVFTGSTAVGRKVQAAAAEHLTPTTLELGGKSPVLVTSSADWDKAVKATAYGKFINAGQTCIAPDYVLVPAGSETRFAKDVIAAAEAAYPALGADYTSVITHRAFDRLAGMVGEAVASGAPVFRHRDGDDREQRRLAPVAIVNPPETSQAMQEEIFGPVLPVVGYRTMDEAIAAMRRHPHPLALYVFSRTRADIDRTLSAVSSGGVTVNGVLLHVAQEDLPFGGVGASGIGAYHGRAGFERFTHARSVFHTGPVNPTTLISPPYGKRTDRIARLLTRQ